MPSRNTYCLTWVSLILDVGYLLSALLRLGSCRSVEVVLLLSAAAPDQGRGVARLSHSCAVTALYSQQKQDRELTVAQIMNSLLPNSDLN